MTGVSEQSREACTRVEAREAAPVDRAGPAHERRRLKRGDAAGYADDEFGTGEHGRE